MFDEALVCFNSQDFPKALELTQSVIALEPKWEEAWEQLAVLIQYLGDRLEAERALGKAREFGIRSNRFWYLLAQSLHGPIAQEAYRLALKDNPDDEQSLLELAWSFRSTGNKEAANKLYRYLLDVYTSRGDWSALNSLGDTLRRLVGNLDDAEEALRRSLGIKPDNFDTWKNISYLMCSRRDPSAAQQTVRRFLQSYPEHPKRAEAWVCLANVLRSFNDLTGAAEAVRQAIDVDPTGQVAWSKLADISFETGNFNEGQRALTRANELDRNKRFDTD